MIGQRDENDKWTVDIEEHLGRTKCQYHNCSKLIDVAVNEQIFIKTNGETGAYKKENMQFCSRECATACQCSHEG